MFHRLLMPVGGNLPLPFLVAAVPIAVVLTLLGIARQPAWQALLAGLTVASHILILVWKLPPELALSATIAGTTFAIWPVMWIIFNVAVLKRDQGQDCSMHHGAAGASRNRWSRSSSRCPLCSP